MLILFGAVGPAQAQVKVQKNPAPKIEPDEEVVYDKWVTSWGLRDDPPDRYPLGGTDTYATEAEAKAAAYAHIARTAGNGDLAVTHYLIVGDPSVRKKSVERLKKTLDLLTRLREAKEAVDHAKKVGKGEASVLKANERTLGDTIREYRDMVAQSYRQAVEAKKTLVGGVAALTDAKMREVNGLIDQYSRQVQDFRSVMGSSTDLGSSPLARVQPPKPAPGEFELARQLEGTTWVLRLDDGQTVTFEFQTEGKLSWENMSASGRARTTGSGTWSVSGDELAARMGVAFYRGKIMGNQMSGSKTSGSKLFTWTGSKQ
jgi:hypothetical protein